MELINSTALDSERLRATFERHTEPYDHTRLWVRVRYSRKADYSGTCYYRNQRIFVNIGRRVVYPYTLGTYLAKARTQGSFWTRDVFQLHLGEAAHLALFIYLHELFHHLVQVAGRCVRRKEAMCDRFAARVLIDEYGCVLTDRDGRSVPREAWDFQDLEGYVARAPRRQKQPAILAARPYFPQTAATPRPIPVLIRGFPGRTQESITRPAIAARRPNGQLLFFGDE